jgi:sugar lactone lactonase YvrE
MTARSRLRLLFAALLSALLSVALLAPAEARPRHSYPDRIELPAGFQPEGITIGKAPVAYLGSRTDGDIVAANLKTGQLRLVSEGLGTGFPSIGLKVDKRGLLYVAGGTAGTGRVISARTGKILADYDFTDAANTFVNDVVLTDRYAWFTDSRQAQLYRVERARNGRNADSAEVRTVPLSGEWEQVQVSGPTTNNANGIAQTPDGRALLVVNSATGKLFRVDPQTGVATQVDLGGYALTNGDGLLVQGRTLYVVQNRLNRVAVIELNRRGTAGELVKTLTSPDFDVPTTVAAYKGSLYLPNARFGVASPLTADYWITRIDK